MACTDVQTIQAGDGTKVLFSFDFPYIFKSEIRVYFWNATTKEWDEKLTTDATYPWQITDANPTIVEFTGTAPPSPTTPTDPGEPTVDNVRIRRVTKVDTIRALFNPGSAIRSDDLNKNFEQLRYAIQESACQDVPDEIYQFLENYYWNKYDDAVYQADTWPTEAAVKDQRIASIAAQEQKFDNDYSTIVQAATPTGSYPIGKTWLQNDSDLTLSIWNGSAWLGIVSGGTFTNQPKVVYVDASSGDDNNDGHRISRPKLTIKAAINQINADAVYGDGSVVIVAAGVYQEVAPIQIQKKNVSIIGQALRSCIVHPTVGTQGDQSVGNHALFELNSGSFIQNLTLTGMKAGTGTGNTVDAVLPTRQGWNFAFLSGATITKSPYIQNCTNFSDSEIDNSNLNANTPAGGLAGDLDSAPTGGGMLVDGSVVSSSSPLRSMVADSYTHVGLNGPGILVTNNGYCQATSSYAFFNKYHIKTLNGGQANLAASTTDFGDEALVADGKSTSAIFTSNVDGAASSGAITFNINQPTAGAGWFGNAVRPASNMLVEVNSVIYPVLSATANTDSEGGAGWAVTISRPNPAKRSENLGLNGAISDNAAVSFYLRSMIASSGHTMEYVGSGTDYRALPENGGVPDDTKQIVESNNGKVWTAITDHNGKFKIGDFFEVDQRTGFINFSAGSYAFDVVTDTTPELGGNLDALTNDIVNVGSVGINTSSPTQPLDVNGTINSKGNATTLVHYQAQDEGAAANERTWRLAQTNRTNKSLLLGVCVNDAANAAYTPITITRSGYSIGNIQFATGNGLERARIDSSGRMLVGTSSSRNVGSSLTQLSYLQIESSASTLGGGINVTANRGDALGASINLAKSRASAVGGVSILAANDEVGIIRFAGADGTDLETPAASIQAFVDGTPGANDMPGRLVFSTTADGASSPTERMRIDSSGNVGIGTSGGAPGLNNTLRQKPTAGAAGYFAEGANSDTWLGLYSGTSASDSAALFYPSTGSFRIGSTTTTGTTGFSEKLRIDSSGNVGIGTSSPAQDLHVYGLNPQVLVQQNTGVAGPAGFNVAAAGANSSANASYYQMNGGCMWGQTGGLGIRFGPHDRSIVNMLINTTNGNVGIGTGAPSSLLSLYAGANSEYFRGGGNGVTTRDLVISASTGTNAGDTHTINASGSTGRLIFSTASSERMRITNGGNVGIGTSSPAGLLHVSSAGTTRLYVEGNDGRSEIRAANGNLEFFTNQDANASGLNTTVFYSNGNNENLRITSDGKLILGGTTSATAVNYSLVTSGRIQSNATYSNTTSSAANVFINAQGLLLRGNTSSARYKTNIETMEDGYADAVLNARPVYFNSIANGDSAHPEWSYWGFIAEEIAEIDPRLVFYEEDDDGNLQAEGVQYDRFVPHLINLVKRQKDQIADLTARIEALEAAG